MDNEFSRFEQYVPDAAPAATPDGSGSRFDQFEQYAPDSVPDASSSGFAQFEQYAPSDGSLTPETDKALSQIGSEFPTGEELTKAGTEAVNKLPIPEHVASFLQGAGIPTTLEGLKAAGKFLVRSPVQDVRDIYQAISELPGRLSNFKQTWKGSPAATVYNDPFSKEAFGVYGTAVGMLIPAAEKGIAALKGAPEAAPTVPGTPESVPGTPDVVPEAQPLQTIEAKLPLGGEEDAISQPETAQSNGNVLQPEVPIESAGQMPADVGSEGIPASGQREILEPETSIAPEQITEPVISPESPAAEQPTEVSQPIAETAAPVPTTYFKGDKAEYTGNVHQLHGGTFYEVKMLEGADAGKLKVVTKPPTEDAGARPVPEFVQRIEEPNTPLGSVDKPHGLYTNPADAESPHTDLGGEKHTVKTNPAANVLHLDASDFVKTNRGTVGQSAGIAALRNIVPDADVLLKMSKDKLRAELEGREPSVDWSKYHDQQEMLEGYAGIAARKAGYDAIYAIDRNAPEHNEYVGLTNNAFDTGSKPVQLVEKTHTNFKQQDTGAPPVQPKLLPGETQGDLISSTQEEPLKLVGEETPDFEAQMTKAQKAELARMKFEEEQAQLSDFQDYQQRGGQELIDAISSLGGLRETAPDFGTVREAFKAKSKHGTQASARSVVGDIRYGDLFKKNAPHEDALVEALRERGFDIETPGQLADVLDTRLKTGKEIWGMESRAQEADFTGHQGYAMGVRGQPDLTTRIIKSVQSAVDAIQTGIGRKPLGAIEPPTLNLDTGGIKPPPPDSIFSPDTPPGEDPVPIYATRVNSAFKRWWEKFWPRDLAVQKLDKTLVAKGKEPSPVVSAHQEILRTNMNYMQNFSEQPWWRALRGRPESEIIDVEDRVIKEYRKHLENGVDREQAYKGAVGKAPKWLQDIVRQRESRIPIEAKAAEELGVDPPKYTGDPYIARLTNEEGKDVVDLNPRLSNIGKQIRTTIGSFDNSREHVTMKDGIAAGTQYEPVARAVWLREMNSIRLESTADLVRSLKEKGVLFDSKKAAFDASPAGRISLVRGLGGKQYWARSPEEAVFLEQNISAVPRSPLGRVQQLANTYVRNPSLVNPLPHVTKNMFFKYLMARINNATFRGDVADFARANPSELKTRFDRVMPFSESSERMPQLTAREVGTWAEKASTRGMSKLNDTSTKFIFGKADPAMRYALWKSYVRKGMADQEAANHVWIDLIRYDANSGGMNFWKSIPFNFFVPWRTGTYVTLAKALTSHPIRTLAFIGAVEYMREMRYRKSGRWTHLPVDYIDAPLAEAVESGTKVHDFKSGRESAQMAAMVAATTLVFGPGGGQAPSTIKDMMAVLQNDPQQKARVMNMFWGLSQIYDLPREWNAFQKDNDPKHLVNLLTSAALAEHSALKYEPRRLMKWLPEWMPGLQKSEIVQQAEEMQARVTAKAEKGKATYEARHGVSANFERSPEAQQIEELGRAAGVRKYGRKGKTIAAP